MFLKSVEIIQPEAISYEDIDNSAYDGARTFPKMNNDPFAAPTPSGKPLAPRTSALVELPTCPVCLERMDETTGLLTILCQHVFHCTCLEKWSGGGCPVCRYTHDDFSTKAGSHKYKSKLHTSEYEVTDGSLECEECHTEENLWQCLICGKVGCGRYGGKHAYKHYEASGHTFSMDLVNKRVWDYAADVYVHRIIQDATKPGEKLVELPGRRREGMTTALEADEDIEIAKLENIALEYTHLLTSQLESQRVYFEEIVERAADKASTTGKQADQAKTDLELMQNQLQKLTAEHDNLINRILPEVETQKQRFEKRSSKYEEEAKNVKIKYLEEQSLASSLLDRVKHLENEQIASLQKRIQELETDNATQALLMEGLQEEHRDAMIQVSAQETLRKMVENGELDEEDLAGATITAGPSAKPAQKSTNKSSTAVQRAKSILENPLTEIIFSTMMPDAPFQPTVLWSAKEAGSLIDGLNERLDLASMSYEQTSDAYLKALLDAGLIVDRAHTGPNKPIIIKKAPIVDDKWYNEVIYELHDMDRETLEQFSRRVAQLEGAGLLVRTPKPVSNLVTSKVHSESETEAAPAPSKPKKKKNKGKKK